MNRTQIERAVQTFTFQRIYHKALRSTYIDELSQTYGGTVPENARGCAEETTRQVMEELTDLLDRVENAKFADEVTEVS